MTVAELIAKLETLDPKLEVRLADWNECYADPASIPPEWVSVAVRTDATYVLIGLD